MDILLTMIFLATPVVANSQSSPVIDGGAASFPGVWKGDSVCQFKDSPCHDEVSVYYVTKGAQRDNFQMTMNKVVDGKEETMGTVGCKVGADTGTYVCRLNDFTLWSWKLDRNVLDGTLQYRGQLYRKIHLTRTR
jgi:hypothetical protein